MFAQIDFFKKELVEVEINLVEIKAALDVFLVRSHNTGKRKLSFFVNDEHVFDDTFYLISCCSDSIHMLPNLSNLLIMVFIHMCMYSMTLFVSFFVVPTLFMWSRI